MPEGKSYTSSNGSSRRGRVVALVFILAVALTVRSLTAYFIGTHMDDPGWFPSGIYATFDRSAQEWLDGRASILWIDDPSRTDAAVYAPGYPLWLAFIYAVTGSRSPVAVQNVQWVLDSFSILLIVGLGATAFGWRTGMWAGGIAALWPLLALTGASPLADAPTAWFVIAAAWMLALAAKRGGLGWALGAGALVGASCWLRANAMLLVFFWALAVVLLARFDLKRRLLLSGGVVLAGMIVISPIVVRNAVAFHAFVPIGLGAGTNMLAGIGDTERGALEFGIPKDDSDVVARERAALDISPDEQFTLYYPDGIERDRKRMREAMAIIMAHPLWYAGTVAYRMAAVMKFAGEPSGIYGSSGINVTPQKCLPPAWQGGIAAALVKFLGMLQSVLRYLLLPLMLVGAILAFRANRLSAALIMTTVAYYWLVGSMMHTHIRYGLPMYALLTIFAGHALWRLKDLAMTRRLSSLTTPESEA
jgi:4-amino-4-deoxy-L-arabinose transferase-like glycosyltransferase